RPIPRTEAGPVAGAVIPGTCDGGGAHGCGGRRDRVRGAGTRPAFRTRRAQQGLYARAGDRHFLRGADHPAEPAGRPAVRLPGPADPPRMSALPGAAGGAVRGFTYGRTLRIPAALLLAVLAAALLGPFLSP